MALIEVWSDLMCPWGYLAGIYLRRARDEYGSDGVELSFHVWPRDVAEDAPQVPARLDAEMVAAAQHEPTAFSRYTAPTWPSSSLPASEAQRWGYSLGPEVGDAFDLALRRALFLHGRDVSQISQLVEIANNEGLDGEHLAMSLRSGRFRPDVEADISEGASVVKSTPTIVVAGTSYEHPGFDLDWVRGIPVVSAAHPGVYREIVEQAASYD